MPYESNAQDRYFNANRAKLEKQGVNVDEWNKASKGKHLPERVQHLAQGGPVMALSKGTGLKDAEFAKGGGTLGRSADWAKRNPQGRGEFGKFLGTPDRFSGLEVEDRVAGGLNSQRTAEDWTKPKGVGHTDKDDKGDTKSEKPIKPRK